jgi:hypothetical protein
MDAPTAAARVHLRRTVVPCQIKHSGGSLACRHLRRVDRVRCRSRPAEVGEAGAVSGGLGLIGLPA